jgi:hypothetical protein
MCEASCGKHMAEMKLGVTVHWQYDQCISVHSIYFRRRLVRRSPAMAL